MWAQAVIDVDFLPLQTLNDTSLRSGWECVEVLNLVPTSVFDPPPVNLYVTTCGSGAGAPVAVGWQGGNGMVIRDQFIGDSFVVVHTIGHNLGLLHEFTIPGNLMGFDPGAADLTPNQIAEARQSDLLALPAMP
jgi:hypothetical protein